MRDIGRRIRKYRLSRYAVEQNPVRRGIRWVWIGLAAWLLWAGLISEHSFYRLWRAGRELKAAQSDLARSRGQIQSLEAELRDPRARADQAERAIRERGMARPGEIIYREDAKGPAVRDSSGDRAR